MVWLGVGLADSWLEHLVPRWGWNLEICEFEIAAQTYFSLSTLCLLTEDTV